MPAIGKNLGMSVKRKILWLSNFAFSEVNIKATGTWLIAMGDAMVKSGKVDLYNITYEGGKTFDSKNYMGITQWVIPNERTSNGMPSGKVIEFIRQKENEIQPDLIHIWGTEHYWGMLNVKKILVAPVLLEIQGLLSVYEKVFYGGLTNKELVECIGVKEILLPQRLYYFRHRIFKQKGKFEQFIISQSKNIAVQSEWVNTHIRIINPHANIYRTDIILRKQFYNAAKWNANPVSQIIFTSSSGSNIYKGLHVVFRALATLATSHPKVVLHVAGSIKYDSYFQDGYTTWLLKLAKELKIENRIVWLGPLDEREMVTQLQKASVCVIPSFIETYCVALAEAMMIGTPCVVSYAGAMPELAVHGSSALFFPIDDAAVCSTQMEAILSNNAFARQMSLEAIKTTEIRNDPEKILNLQLDIYEKVISNGC